jgi:hypothetical protein
MYIHVIQNFRVAENPLQLTYTTIMNTLMMAADRRAQPLPLQLKL